MAHLNEDMEHIRSNTLTLATTDLKEALGALTTQISITTELAKQASITQDQMSQVISALGTITSILGPSGGMK